MATNGRDRRSVASGRRGVREEGESASKRRFPLPILVVAAAILLVLLVALGRFCSAAATIDVTVNGNALSLHGAKTLDTAIRESGWPVNPGDLISLEGVVLKRGSGNPFYATVNGEETLDRDRTLANGDEIYLTDGKDIVEDYDVVEETIPSGMLVLGIGALCTFEEGVPKIVEHLTGRLSGAEVDRLKQAEEKRVAQWHAPDVGNDKVIALTFDCGPSVEYTNQILNVLAENNVKATFFCEGKNAKANPDLVQREWEEGHQIASNTYDCLVTEKSSDEQVINEVEQGFEALDEILAGSSRKADGEQLTQPDQGQVMQPGQQQVQMTTWAQQPRVIRFPNALLTTDMASVIDDKVDVVVGWTLDSGDWVAYDSDSVYKTLMEAEPGEIVVLHDGDYDCSATADALRKALPELKAKGFSFVTIDELMAYPAKSED